MFVQLLWILRYRHWYLIMRKLGVDVALAMAEQDDAVTCTMLPKQKEFILFCCQSANTSIEQCFDLYTVSMHNVKTTLSKVFSVNELVVFRLRQAWAHRMLKGHICMNVPVWAPSDAVCACTHLSILYKCFINALFSPSHWHISPLNFWPALHSELLGSVSNCST